MLCTTPGNELSVYICRVHVLELPDTDHCHALLAIDASLLSVTVVQDFTAAQAALQQMNLQLAAAVAERNMAEPKSRLAAEEARVHAENAVVSCCQCLQTYWESSHPRLGLCSAAACTESSSTGASRAADNLIALPAIAALHLISHCAPLMQAAEEKAKKSAQRWRRQAAEVEHLKDVELRLWEQVRSSSDQCKSAV